MKIAVLVENTTRQNLIQAKHGLSIYIETQNHRLLFDLGPDDTFLRNARQMGIDLKEVDTVVISHGHGDHGGALARFLQINDRATIYVHRQAFEPHYIKVLFQKFNVGLSAVPAQSDRIVQTGDTVRIDEELFLFSDVEGQFDIKSNCTLLKQTADGYVRDDFAHEQNLILTAEGKTVLFSGCSHRGITNILRAARGHQPDIHAVFGGFHLYNPATKATVPAQVVQKLAEELIRQDTVFYTCHCTGKKAFGSMKQQMGDQIQYVSAGAVLEWQPAP